jgi:hypothetical protein
MEERSRWLATTAMEGRVSCGIMGETAAKRRVVASGDARVEARAAWCSRWREFNCSSEFHYYKFKMHYCTVKNTCQ